MSSVISAGPLAQSPLSAPDGPLSEVAATPAPTTPAAVCAAFEALRQAGLRARDAAERLGLSEGAVLAAHALAGAEGAVAEPPASRLGVLPLNGHWVDLLKALEPCGPLMALTRNHSVVHEKTGVYRRVSAQGEVGLVLDRDIDLRLFLAQWHAGFAVRERPLREGQFEALSLQFFDAWGHAVHKVFVREATDRLALEAVMARFAAPEARPQFAPGRAPRPVPRPDAECHADALCADWAALRDTHDFFALLKRHGLDRRQSFRLAEGRFTTRLPSDAIARLLHLAAASGLGLMVFVGNAGCIQIHSGPVQRVVPLQTDSGQWLNVMDPGFNLHLRADLLDQVWAVDKPSDDGVVSSVEAFDADGELMLMVFGERKPGQAQDPAWHELVHSLRPGAQEAA